MPPARRRVSVAALRESLGSDVSFAARPDLLEASFARVPSKARTREASFANAPQSPLPPTLEPSDEPLRIIPPWVRTWLREWLPTANTLRVLSYLTFVGLFTAWLVSSRDSELSFIFAKLVREKVAGSELHPSDERVPITFNDISSVTQVQQFLRGPMIDALFGDQTSTATGDFDLGWFNSQSRLVGAARIRQVRVATNSCAIGNEPLAALVPTCYPSLSDGWRRRAPLYGSDLGGGLRRVYRYVEGDDFPFLARVNGYGSGGYVANLPARKLHALAILEQMELDRFLSLETRLLVVDFTLYNANINTFCIVRLAFEFLETGGVVPHATFATARLLPYEGAAGSAQLVLDGLIITCAPLLPRPLPRALRARPGSHHARWYRRASS